MTNFDEYQKLLRYKHGHHAFLITMFLMFTNFIIDLSSDFQWAETKELESIIFMFVGIIYSVALNTYHGAYFDKKQNPKKYALIFFLLGIMNLYLTFSSSHSLLVDGRVSKNTIMAFSAVLWLSIPAAYILRKLVEKIRKEEDYDE